jgi:hypothetical protein
MKKLIVVLAMAAILVSYGIANSQEISISSYTGKGYVGLIFIDLIIPFPYISYFPANALQMMLPVRLVIPIIPLTDSSYIDVLGLGYGVAGANSQVAFYINATFLPNVLAGKAFGTFNTAEECWEAGKEEYIRLFNKYADTTIDDVLLNRAY